MKKRLKTFQFDPIMSQMPSFLTLGLNEEELKEKDLEISLLKKLESEFNIDSEQISDLLKNNCTVQSIEQPESELVGDNFIKIEYSNDNI
jgi:hypothetical protein